MMTVYAVGLFQGLALVAVPAASSVLTSTSGYGLSDGEYGLLFVPQVLLAIAGSLAMPAMARKVGVKRLLLVGIAVGALSMGLLTVSTTVQHTGAALPLLLAATAALGFGFGVTLSCLSTIAGDLAPTAPERSLTALNVFLGLGTALSPLLVGFLTRIGEWWYLPLLAASGLVVLAGIAWRQDLTVDGPATRRPRGIPRAFWLFAAALVAYGICETMFGNWGTALLRDRGTSAATANYALAAFWAAVTAGRFIISVLPARVPSRAVYVVLPWAIAATLVLVATVADGTAGIAVFAAAGFACSGFFPMTIGYGEAAFPDVVVFVSGWLVAAYQVGYGLAAFGAGALDAVVPLGVLLAGAAALAAGMGLLAVAVARVSHQDRARQPPDANWETR
ncbi:MAG: MFS transporter [Acidimicrobiia bacterium]|nr:MFS transporter [Acidimicrobiia bacterium]